jgi:hypothetical protein
VSDARPSVPLLAAAFAACLLLIVGALGTWQVADVNTFGFHVHATATGVEHGSDGPIVIGMTVVAGIMLLFYAIVPGKPIWAAVVALVIACLALLTSVADTIDVADRSFRSPGWGLYLDIGAALGLTAVAALLVREAVLHGRAVRAARPVAPWPGQPAQASPPTQPTAPTQPAPPAQPAAPPTAAPAGWHPDPWRQKRLRYWDGAQWTGHTAD